MFWALITFIVVFVICFVAYLIVIKVGHKKYKPGKETLEMTYLRFKYKIDIQKIGYLKVRKTIALMNSFIVGLTVAANTNVRNYFLILLISAIVVITLIILLYNILGKYYQKKGWVLNGK